MWRQALTAILSEMRRFDMRPQPPCGDQGLKHLNHALPHVFGTQPPSEYMEFLSIVDGLDWNGLAIFSSRRQLILGHTDRYIEGIVDRNLMHRDNSDMARYLVLGEDGTVFFGLDVRSGKYAVVTIVGLSVLESFATCSDLLTSAMDSHL